MANSTSSAMPLTVPTSRMAAIWPNPISKRLEPKSAYVIRVDANTVCGSGYYKG